MEILPKLVAASALFLVPASTGALVQPNALGSERVAFVGCRSDGQQGPQSAPKAGVAPRTSSDVAPKLAYYKAKDSIGVLAPRGWHCFGLYGSNGTILIVAPEAHSSRDFFGKHLFSTTGPAVVLV